MTRKSWCTPFREAESVQNSKEEYLNAESHDMDNKSDGSDCILPKSNRSSSSKGLDSNLHKEEPERRVGNIFLTELIMISSFGVLSVDNFFCMIFPNEKI